MRQREELLTVLKEIDWDFSYVDERQVYPEDMSGPFLSKEAWANWDEPFKTLYKEYVATQSLKEIEVATARDLVGRLDDLQSLSAQWLNGLKLHSATLPLAEFGAVIGNLRASRFGRACRWRSVATYGALDELRHTQIPLLVMHEMVRHDSQFDWTHKFFHSDNWVAIAARHLIDELLLGSNAIEYAIATNFVFETGFTNLQFVGLSSLAHMVKDRMFEKMVTSIQSDEARHAQAGPATLEVLAKYRPEYAQELLDKWFWRSWLLFSIVTGICMDYMTPLEHRQTSFKEFMEEWVLNQYASSLEKYGLKKPWYWDLFMENLEVYHHMVYVSAYTYRATVWFDMHVPSPEERLWLQKKYPKFWSDIEPIWKNIIERWQESNIGNDFAVHGTCIIGFCSLCQIVLSNGTPHHNHACLGEVDGQTHIFCSEPCKQLFLKEPHRYSNHKNIVDRVLANEAPGNLIAMLRNYFGLKYEDWGRDLHQGDYPWMERST